MTPVPRVAALLASVGALACGGHTEQSLSASGTGAVSAGGAAGGSGALGGAGGDSSGGHGSGGLADSHVPTKIAKLASILRMTPSAVFYARETAGYKVAILRLDKLTTGESLVVESGLGLTDLFVTDTHVFFIEKDFSCGYCSKYFIRRAPLSGGGPVVTLGTTEAIINYIAVAGEFVWLIGINQLYRLPLSGGNVEMVAPSETGPMAVGDLAVYFWATSFSVGAWVFASSQPGTFQNLVGVPKELRADSGFLYWAEYQYSKPQISRAPEVGGPSEIVVPSIGSSGRFAVNGNTVFFTDGACNEQLHRVDITAHESELWVAGSCTGLNELVLDDHHLYYTVLPPYDAELAGLYRVGSGGG